MLLCLFERLPTRNNGEQESVTIRGCEKLNKLEFLLQVSHNALKRRAVSLSWIWDYNSQWPDFCSKCLIVPFFTSRTCCVCSANKMHRGLHSILFKLTVANSSLLLIARILGKNKHIKTKNFGLPTTSEWFHQVVHFFKNLFATILPFVALRVATLHWFETIALIRPFHFELTEALECWAGGNLPGKLWHNGTCAWLDVLMLTQRWC